VCIKKLMGARRDPQIHWHMIRCFRKGLLTIGSRVQVDEDDGAADSVFANGKSANVISSPPKKKKSANVFLWPLFLNSKLDYRPRSSVLQHSNLLEFYSFLNFSFEL